MSKTIAVQNIISAISHRMCVNYMTVQLTPLSKPTGVTSELCVEDTAQHEQTDKIIMDESRH